MVADDITLCACPAFALPPQHCWPMIRNEAMLAASNVNEQICRRSLPVILTSCSEVSWCCSKIYIHGCSSKSCWMAMLSTKARERLLWGAPGRGECSNIPCRTGGEIMPLSGLNLSKFGLGGPIARFQKACFRYTSLLTTGNSTNSKPVASLRKAINVFTIAVMASF